MLAYPEYVVRDLANSGLTPEDISARPLEGAERAATATPHSIQGYVIPYYDINGKLTSYYRAKLFDTDTQYRQPTDSPSYIYYPKTFRIILGQKKYVIITEHEKRAAIATKHGFPAIALGSVDGWQNRLLTISGDAALSKASATKLQVRLPATGDVQEDYQAALAVGMIDLIDLITSKGLHVIIIYDSDSEEGPRTEVQRAAAALGFELRYRGIPFERIRQVVLPYEIDPESDLQRVGLDDLLTSPKMGPRRLIELLRENLAKKGAFPRHPNVRDYIAKRLQRQKISRKEMQGISMAVLSELDSHGIRLRAPTGGTYYFDYVTKKLMKAEWPNRSAQQFEAKFNQHIYREYGLSAVDDTLLTWLGTQFASEEPIETVAPYRIFMHPANRDAIFYQLTDSEFAEISADGLVIHANGDMNVLFESDQVDPVNTKEVQRCYLEQEHTAPSCWWAQTLSQVRLRDKDKQRIVAALLYYMSPWLFRWRGMQLPVELIVGESGSGKSTLCELRLEILTGRPLLRNTPTDLKDWHASIANTGGLHVTDNVQLTDKSLRQRLSDEICRIVTEPEPFIEQRRYYTNADILRIPIHAIFAITSIQQPFHNADLLQRAFLLELDKSIEETAETDSKPIRYDSNWKSTQLARFGGREAWIAHHLGVLQRFFRLVQNKWDLKYEAKTRLINFEQAIMLMADVFAIPNTWIPDFLVRAQDRATSEADWILEGIHAFALEHNRNTFKAKRFYASTISEWCEDQPDYKENEILTSARKLGRYMSAHKSAIYHLTGIAEAQSQNNRSTYFFKGRTLDRTF